MSEKTISRETAIDALRCLAAADAVIRKVKGTSNEYRTETIAKMESQLNVKVTTKPYT